jgi:hypothetical protein
MTFLWQEGGVGVGQDKLYFKMLMAIKDEIFL